MEIALCGTHSTGKTSIINLLCKEEQFDYMKKLTNTTRKMNKKGYQINKNKNKNNQTMLLINKLNELENNLDYLSDRTLIDGLAYSIVNKVYNKSELKIIKNLVYNSVILLSYIFYIPINSTLESDGIRNSSEDYRKLVDNEIIKILKKNQFDNVFILKKDNIQGYAKQIKEIINSRC